MNKLIKALLFALPLALMGCADEYDTTVNTAGTVNNGCIVVSDADGDRQVCSQYYVANGSYVFWDPNFGIWVNPAYGYYRAGMWYRGAYPGYGAFYHGFYHPHGFYRGGFRGNGYRGGGHGGGGGHFGGHGGGHR
jgi:hypothetical protein